MTIGLARQLPTRGSAIVETLKAIQSAVTAAAQYFSTSSIRLNADSNCPATWGTLFALATPVTQAGHFLNVIATGNALNNDATHVAQFRLKVDGVDVAGTEIPANTNSGWALSASVALSGAGSHNVRVEWQQVGAPPGSTIILAATSPDNFGATLTASEVGV